MGYLFAPPAGRVPPPGWYWVRAPGDERARLVCVGFTRGGAVGACECTEDGWHECDLADLLARALWSGRIPWAPGLASKPKAAPGPRLAAGTAPFATWD